MIRSPIRQILPALLAAAIGCAPAFLAADEALSFDPGLAAGAKCKIEVTKLHPTQFCVGLEEVKMRIERCREMSAKKLDKYLHEKTAPIVIGPGGTAYIVDHHHLARVLFDGRASPMMYAEVKANWNGLSGAEFWKRMEENHWVYPYDENGKGPLDVANLPKSMGEMRDDRYRSLSWAVRQKDGYRDTGEYFADFKWADLFRNRIKIEPGTDGFDLAVTRAIALAHSADAKNLPGFIGEK